LAHEGIRDRPIMLCREFDGMSAWKQRGGNPLDQFDIILIEDSLSDSLLYIPDAQVGRSEVDYKVGSTLSMCTLAKAVHDLRA
jgi:hypothetical protein